MNYMQKENESDDMIQQHENYLRSSVKYHENALVERKEMLDKFLKDKAKYKKIEE